MEHSGHLMWRIKVKTAVIIVIMVRHSIIKVFDCFIGEVVVIKFEIGISAFISEAGQTDTQISNVTSIPSTRIGCSECKFFKVYLLMIWIHKLYYT
jgi:hypothetical protein